MASLLGPLLLPLSLIIINTRSETVQCDAQSKNADCACNQSGLCQLICNIDDKCTGSDVDLTCYPGYPCEIYCGGVQNCKDVSFNANSATSIQVICDAKDDAKDQMVY